MDCRFNRNRWDAVKHATSPLFKGVMICDENLSISFWAKKVLALNKQSWPLGFSILELSKLVMYRLFYETIQPRFGVNGTELLLTDTDSFLLRLFAPTTDLAVKRLEDVMDLSNYPVTHSLFDASRAKELGYLKNELPCQEIAAFCGLKSKTYAVQMAHSSQHMVKAKGVPHHSKKDIPFASMVACLQKIAFYPASFNTIRAKNHVNLVIRSSRLAFSSFDDKRYLLCCRHSVPYGSCLIPKRLKEHDKESMNDLRNWDGISLFGPLCPFCQQRTKRMEARDAIVNSFGLSQPTDEDRQLHDLRPEREREVLSMMEQMEEEVPNAAPSMLSEAYVQQALAAAHDAMAVGPSMEDEAGYSTDSDSTVLYAHHAPMSEYDSPVSEASEQVTESEDDDEISLEEELTPNDDDSDEAIDV